MYLFPEDLGVLKTWMSGRGHNVAGIVSERQAAFHAQQMAGTNFRFPAKGQPCHGFLLNVQKRVVEQSTARTANRPNETIPGASPRPALTKSSLPISYEGVVIFTDGSAAQNRGIGGWSFVVYLQGEEISHRCGGVALTTNNAMELTGLQNALQWALTRYRGIPLRIYTDSEYAVNCATIWSHGWAARNWIAKGGKPVKNLELVKAIYNLVDQLPYAKIAWCRGHAGERGNERADELATQGRMLAKAANDNTGVAA